MDDKTMKLFGYGVLEGRFELPDDVSEMIFGLTRAESEAAWREARPDGEPYPGNISNPRIRLDNGDIAWGCFCWFGAEEKIRAWEASRKVEMIDMNTWKADCLAKSRAEREAQEAKQEKV